MLVGSVTNPEEINQIGPLVDLIELRLDYFEILKKPIFPCIFTVRKKEQGGVGDLEESKRIEKIEKYLKLDPEYCDIEADTDIKFIEKIAKKFPKVKFIGSYHNFDETPADLERVLESMKNPNFAIYKIAVRANSTSDMLRLMLFARNSKEPLSVISMGEFGKPSRVLAKIMGSQLDYTGLNEDDKLNRYDVKTLLDTFHYRKLNRYTPVYALIGDPVESSPGHIFHNLHFQQMAVYVKMIVRPFEVNEVFSLIRKLPFRGLSVTIPLKEALQDEMEKIEPIAKSIGAINTITIKNGKMVGTNTDGIGALNALEKHIEVKGKKLALIGAGGSARAIAFEAIKRGAEVAIFNRTPKRAETLAEDLGCKGFDLEALPKYLYEILVNTTPPTSVYIPPIRSHSVVMDIVIVPKETPILKEAKSKECRCIFGEEMFIEQALLQQSEWRQNG